MRRRVVIPMVAGVAVLASMGGLSAPAMARAICHPRLESMAVPDLGVPAELTGVAALARQDAWAVGNVDGEAQALRIHWDGRSWTPVGGPDPGLSDALEGVDATSSNDVWAVGAAFDGIADRSLIEHWDGSSWTVSPNPGMHGLLSVAAVSPTDVWAGGELLTVMHWDGTAWSFVPHPPLEEGDLHGADAIGPNDVWIVGGVETEGGGDKNLALHWDGSDLLVIPTELPDTEASELFGVAALSPTDVWVVGEQEEADGRARTLIEHWDGTGWAIVPSPNPSPEENELRGISAASPTDIWAVGGYAIDGVDHPLALHWDGAAWRVFGADEPVPTGGTTEFHGVDARTTQDVWAVGAHGLTEEEVDPLIEHRRGC
jgi:hypothetical protein